MATTQGELLVLILSNGMPFGDLSAIIDGLKTSSKSIGSHKRRELYWQAYTDLSSKVAGMDGAANCFLMYRLGSDGEGEVELAELTKRQRGLVGGGCEVLGHKIKPADDPTSKNWCLAFCEDEAPRALEDLMAGEPCIYLTAEGVYVATRYKRALCKGLSGPLKTLKDVEKVVSELAPEKPLKSVSFLANDPPARNSYNVFLAGPSNLGPDLPPMIGHVATTSTSEIYDYFCHRRNSYLIAEAGKLIAQLQTDVAKNQTPIISAGSTKEATIAYKNALMKRVYVHESMKKFVDRVRSDGQVEIFVIAGDVTDSDFGRFGSLVFELFYRVDLTTLG
eukprot:gene2150-2855_t